MHFQRQPPESRLLGSLIRKRRSIDRSVEIRSDSHTEGAGRKFIARDFFLSCFLRFSRGIIVGCSSVYVAQASDSASKWISARWHDKSNHSQRHTHDATRARTRTPSPKCTYRSEIPVRQMFHRTCVISWCSKYPSPRPPVPVPPPCLMLLFFQDGWAQALLASHALMWGPWFTSLSLSLSCLFLRVARKSAISWSWSPFFVWEKPG